jgi:hypothetical protein
VHEIREAYRINAVILLGQGRGVKGVADALLLDPEAVRSYFKREEKGGLEELLRMSDVGSEALLNSTQLRELDAHLRRTAYQTAAHVARYVEQTDLGPVHAQRHDYAAASHFAFPLCQYRVGVQDPYTY